MKNIYNQRIRSITKEDNCTEKSVDGVIHCEDGPAFIWPDESAAWWKHGKLHRDEGPAFMCAYTSLDWYINGVKQIAEYEVPECDETPDSLDYWATISSDFYKPKSILFPSKQVPKNTP
jgi:hypothetical protein